MSSLEFWQESSALEAIRFWSTFTFAICICLLLRNYMFEKIQLYGIKRKRNEVNLKGYKIVWSNYCHLKKLKTGFSKPSLVKPVSWSYEPLQNKSAASQFVQILSVFSNSNQRISMLINSRLNSSQTFSFFNQFHANGFFLHLLVCWT